MPLTSVFRSKPCLIGALMLAVAACAPLPKGTEENDLGFFEDAVASIDCKLVKGSDYYAVQFQADMTREEVLKMAGYELGAGRAERLEGGGIRLIDGPCAPGAEPVGQPIELMGGV